MTDVFIKRGKLDAETDMHMGECIAKIGAMAPQTTELLYQKPERGLRQILA